MNLVKLTGSNESTGVLINRLMNKSMTRMEKKEAESQIANRGHYRNP